MSFIAADGTRLTTPIEDYALLGNLRSAALVSRGGAIDWFCPGRFDAPACFAALLGRREHGHWSIAPRDEQARCERSYLEDTLVLEMIFSTGDGKVRLSDAMTVGDESCIVRCIEGLEGRVPMRMQCCPRFHYGRDLPSVRGSENRVTFCGDGLKVTLSSDCNMVCDEHTANADFELAAGERRWFVLACARADEETPTVADPVQAVDACAAWWRGWVSRCTYSGPWERQVKRSLITLKAMIYEPSGAMVAAPTTSLPEVPGGGANWDYRFCWLRDAAFALKVLINAGYADEAKAWRDWLQDAVDCDEDYLDALFTVDAKAANGEEELDWLPGYLDSRPVRIRNAASRQYQLDIRGELMELLHLARRNGLMRKDEMWQLQCQMLEELAARWREPDTGIWEFRTLCAQLTHSKVLVWVAYDRAIEDAEEFGLPAPLEHWRQLRTEIREDILRNGIDHERGHFTQRYGSPEVDASLLMIPLVGFLPADDPRMTATIAEIERELCSDGLVYRYRTGDQANEEGAFLACCFWLAGRHDEARKLFSRLLELCNDVGLLAEEYNLETRQLQGNYPQGLSHLGLISTAWLLSGQKGSDITLT